MIAHRQYVRAPGAALRLFRHGFDTHQIAFAMGLFRNSPTCERARWQLPDGPWVDEPEASRALNEDRLRERLENKRRAR